MLPHSSSTVPMVTQIAADGDRRLDPDLHEIEVIIAHVPAQWHSPSAARPPQNPCPRGQAPRHHNLLTNLSHSTARPKRQQHSQKCQVHQPRPYATDANTIQNIIGRDSQGRPYISLLDLPPLKSKPPVPCVAQSRGLLVPQLLVPAPKDLGKEPTAEAESLPSKWAITLFGSASFSSHCDI